MTNSNFNKEVAVTHQPSSPILSVSETCPTLGSNPITPETEHANNELSSSQQENILLNAHKIAAATAHVETEKSSSTLNAAASIGAHHSTKEISGESNGPEFRLTNKGIFSVK